MSADADTFIEKRMENFMENIVYRFVSVISCLCIIFSYAYYKSYSDSYEKNQISQKVKEEAVRETALPVENKENIIVKPGASCVYEIYYADTGETLREEGYVSSQFVALKRKDILFYLEDYMKDIPEEEKEKGLVSYKLISFSSDAIRFQKVYSSKNINCAYCLVLENNMVVVYNGNMSEICEYTGINAKELSIEEQKKLSEGIKVKDEAELYSILEDYSS